MAKIWPVYEGSRPTVGWPWAELLLPEAIKLFELRQSDYLADLQSTPRFGPAGHDLTYTGYKHIVVEVEENDVDENKALKEGWKPGFYRSRVKPKEGFRRLIEQPFASVMGANNVERVDYQSTTDSQGQGALKITVVIAPNAIQRLPKRAALDAAARLQERLNEMRDDRTPIIEYATQAELVQDARR